MANKCVVWDLDNTLWDGICLEGDVHVRPVVRKVINELDKRGIIHSIASRNEEHITLKVLNNNKLFDFFVIPRINWLPKTTNIIAISKALNISLDAIAFVDDDPFELDQIRFMLPDVMTIDSADTSQMLDMPEFNPGYVTKESKSRREYYQAEEKRKQAEQQFVTREEYLNSCKMKLTVRRLMHKDIPRAHELMTRTHQMNTTGQVFDRDSLIYIAGSDCHEDIFVAELRDKFGWSGIIGTAVMDRTDRYYRIMFFAMSCRILGRGIERAFLATLAQTALHAGYSEMEALFKSTGKNSMMRTLYQMSGFTNKKTLHDQTMLFRVHCKDIPKVPGWVEVL